MKIHTLAICFSLLSVVLAYINPVQGTRDSPDPGVLHHNGSYYAVTTEGWDQHYFPIWKSTTGTNFTQVGWVLPTGPSWTRCCDYWAPQLHIINGIFSVYYTARDAASGRLSIGVAQSPNILGPYTDKGSPIVTNSSEGVIDATVLYTGNVKYLVYKVDGNAHGNPCLIYAIQLSADGKSVGGPATLLLKNDQSWENGIVEGQWFVKEGAYYYMFYSGCGYNNECYAIGVARATSPLGPYEKHTGPIFKTKNPKTNVSWEGPGHCSVVQSPSGQWLMFYHAWPHNQINTKRLMLLDTVKFVNGWPTTEFGYPSETNQVDPTEILLTQ